MGKAIEIFNPGAFDRIIYLTNNNFNTQMKFPQLNPSVTAKVRILVAAISYLFYLAIHRANVGRSLLVVGF